MEKLHKKLDKNIKLYSLYSTFVNLLILGPVLTLYLLNRGLNFTEILSLQSIAAITITIMEVPTGALGDLVGRKKSLLLGTSLMFISLLVYAYNTEFIYFILAEVLFSVGMSFKSGSDTALLFDSLKKLDRVDEFKVVLGKSQSYALLAQIPGSILAGYVYEIDIKLPFIISAVFMIITFIIELNFEDVEVFENKEKPKYFTQIKQSFITSWKVERVRAVILFTMGFYIFSRISFWIYQPYFTAIDIPVKYFGYIFAVFNLVAAISAKRSHHFIEKTKGNTLIAISIIMILSFIGAGIFRSMVGVIIMCSQQYIRGVYRPSVLKYMNKHIDSEQRATVISIQSLMSNLVVAALMPLAGLIIDNVDIFTANIVFAAILAFVTVFNYFYLNSKLGAKAKVLN